MVAEAVTKTGEGLRQVRLEDLYDSPYQPRHEYEEEPLAELTKSMREHGWRQGSPANVRPRPEGGYELIGGHRRTRAARAAGLERAWVIVVDATDDEARTLALLDNLQREDLSPWEEGEGYVHLAGTGMSVDEIAKTAGKSTTFVRGRMQIAESAGTKLREAYAAQIITTEALLKASKLPNETVAVKECPQCGGVGNPDALTCPSCSRDLRQTIAFEIGNPQEVAVQGLPGKSGVQIDAVIERVEKAYGLTAAPSQFSMGLEVDQLSEEAVEAKSILQKHLEKVSKLEGWFTEYSGCLEEYSRDQLETIASQVAVVEKVTSRIGKAVSRELEAR